MTYWKSRKEQVNLYNAIHFKMYGVPAGISLSLYTLVLPQNVSDAVHTAGYTDEDVARAIANRVNAGELTVVQQENGLAAGPIVDRNGTTFATLVPKGKEELFPNGYRIEAAGLV